MEAVDLGDGPVPVEDELHWISTDECTDCDRTPIPSISTSTMVPGSMSSTAPNAGPARMSPGFSVVSAAAKSRAAAQSKEPELHE